MSLLDGAAELVEIYPQQLTTGPNGEQVHRAAAEPVVVSARVYPVSSDEAIVTGQQVNTMYRGITRTAPVGPWAECRWRGRRWRIVGEPLWRGGSPRTRHVRWDMQALDGQPWRRDEETSNG